MFDQIDGQVVWVPIDWEDGRVEDYPEVEESE